MISKQSIAIVNWPINDVGGINSWCKNFQLGLDTLGVTSVLYHSTSQLQYGCDNDVEQVKQRYSILPGTHLSYHGQHLRKSLAILNQHDLVIFLHPSPHPTRKNVANEHCKNWMEFYRAVNKPKLAIFHDNNWEKTNPWIAEVASNVDAIVAAQYLFTESVSRYPSSCPTRWSYFPLDLANGNSYRANSTKRGCILATQWIKWKNHHKFLPQLAALKVPVSLYGNGQEYYTLRKSGVFQEVINTDHTRNEEHNQTSRHHFYGYVPYNELITAMANSVSSIDLSTKGYTNMTHWEPLTVGTVSLIEERVVDHPANKIPRDCCVPFAIDSAAETIASLTPRTVQSVVAKADSFIQSCACETVTKSILDWLRKSKVVDLR